MAWRIPLFDPALGVEEEQALVEVIRSKWLTMGDRTAAFEKGFAELTGVPVAVACNSATAGLHMALAALGIGPGDDVVVPSLTFVATANAVRYCGARPVFADVASMKDWNDSAASIEKVLTPATRAIIVVHFAGYPCDMPGIMALARSRELAVVEDVRLCQMVPMFPYAMNREFTEDKYAEYFDEATELVETACAEFVPPG